MKKALNQKKKDTLPVAVIDLVCGMDLDPTETKLHVEHKGEVYYFCTTTCKNHFVNDPEKYLGTSN
jgi:Cu+-exporting ATPase